MKLKLITGALLLLFSTSIAFAQNVAITMDNPNSYSAPLMKPEDRDKKILSILKKNHIKIALFAQGAEVDDALGRALLKRWNDAGHMIGNHTYSHINFDTISEEQYEQDALKNEPILQPYSNFKKYFVFHF